MPERNGYLGLVFAIAVSACSKSEPPAPSKPPAPKTAAAAPAAPAKPADIDDGLKERLARQEAAAKMFEAKVLSPPAPKVPEPPAAAKPAPERAAPAPAPAAPQQVAAAPVQAPAKVEPPKAAPAPPRTDVAAVRPPPVPEAPSTRLVSRVDPDFPREAASAGVEKGNVKARLTLDAAGGVTRVEIIEATPRRVFDRAVLRALSQWRYNEGAAGRTVDMEIAFRSQ